ncbi:hypothetical protein G7Y89_g8925 [Cudoniella acicularis]|uniref:Uncharacterized protein n=1 Tax=Cudoniella acicularis TaxID=354080 RepID=A0A8H4W2E7_9HELO|nr:hypothetical protein G7Y89_g8925 [Cudoniella acicularis]
MRSAFNRLPIPEGNEDLLSNNISCHAADDLIYALGSLLGGDIDYEQPIEKLYIAVVPGSIKETQSLNILRHAQHSVWRPGWPSWVPDWRLSPRVVIFQEAKLVRTQPAAYAVFSGNSLQLTVKGVRLQVVLESQLETRLLPGIDKLDTTVDLESKIEAVPDGIARWVIERETVKKLFLPVTTSQWDVRDVTSDPIIVANYLP